MPIKLNSCVLRPWQLADKPHLLQFANNRNVWRNLAHQFPHPYTEADADEWLAFASAQNPCTDFAIEVGGIAVGGIGVRALEGIYARTGEFGYWLGEPYWGRGIATEAARGLVAHIFQQFPFERLEAGVFAWNPASARVLEKAGFTREGLLKQSVFKDGQLIDRMLYAITRD